MPSRKLSLDERIIESGREVAYQEWDSGGPGAGAGRVSIYRYRGKFYVLDDVALRGPYKTFAGALRRSDVEAITSATRETWRFDKGFTFGPNA